jgi:hypothetical protein
MSHVHLISGANSIRLRGLIPPQKDELDLGLAAAVSGGGEVHVSKKAEPSLTLVRMFAGVREEEYRAIRQWYTDVSQGMRNPFLFIDSDGESYTVRWTNDLLDWQRDTDNRWSGVMKLRVEGYEP